MFNRKLPDNYCCPRKNKEAIRNYVKNWKDSEDYIPNIPPPTALNPWGYETACDPRVSKKRFRAPTRVPSRPSRFFSGPVIPVFHPPRNKFKGKGKPAAHSRSPQSLFPSPFIWHIIFLRHLLLPIYTSPNHWDLKLLILSKLSSAWSRFNGGDRGGVRLWQDDHRLRQR